MVWLFHYTTEENLEMIKMMGYIEPSMGEGPRPDAFFGKGVYMTSLNPSEYEKETIAKNNYGRKGWKKALENGKLDCFIQLEIPNDDPKLKPCDTDRDIYLYRGKLVLDKYSPNSSPKHGKNKDWDPTWLIVGAGLGLLGLGLAAIAAWASKDSQQEDEKEKKRKLTRY